MKTNRFLNEFRVLGFEFARTLSYWSLALLIAIPARLAVAEPAANGAPAVSQQADSGTQHFAHFTELLSKYESLAEDDPARGPLKLEVDKLSEEIQIWNMGELAPFETEYAALQKEAEEAKREIDQDKIKALVERFTAPLAVRRFMVQKIGKTNQPTIGFIAGKEFGDTAADQFINATITADSSPPLEGEADAPEKFHQRVLNSMGSGAKQFGTQYVTFSVAMGFIALSQLGVQSGMNAAGFGDGFQSDPNAFENWMKHTFDLLGAEGFAFFMAASHPVTKLTNALMQKVVPPQVAGMFANYVGMTAGMVAQSLFSEFMQDKDLWKCMKPYYNSSLQHDPGACEKMRTNWITKGKILQYAPSIISMISSTALAGGIRASLTSIADPELLRPRAGAGRLARITFKGATLIHKTEGGKLIAKMVKLFPGRLVPVGDFVMFLALDTYVTQEPINHWWQDKRMNYFDPTAWINKKGLHAEFFFPKEGSAQSIANAFDVEATSPYTAHTYLMDFYRRMQDSGWKKPAATESCAPKSVAKSGEISKKWFWQRWAEGKSQEQLTCEVFARPADLLARYNEMNTEWRGIVMAPFSTAQNNWVTMLNQFTTVYGASMKLANHLANEKFKVVHKNSTEKPDLSRATLAKVIGTALPKDGAGGGAGEANSGEEEKANSLFLDGSWLPTPELVDFVMAGFTCGPDAQLDPTKVSTLPLAGWFDTVYSLFARKIASPAYLTTPWGSSLHFIPPKLTTKGRAICENVQNSFYDTMNLVISTKTWFHLPSLSAKTAGTANPFDGPFVDENRKSYPTMADYTFENLDPELYKPVGNYSDFPAWWTNHMTKPITPVFMKYSQVYDKMIDKKYFPLLFDRTFAYGCRAQDDGKANAKGGADDCAHSSNAYRVANGFFMALEIEMRNYMRGLFSLYASTFPKGELTDDLKKSFQELASGIISDMQTDQAADFRTKAFEQKLAHAEETLKIMSDLVESRLKTKSPDNEFRLQMLKTMKDLVAKVIAEERSQIELVQLWNFTGASTRGPVQKVNSPVSANPLKHGGG